MASSSYGPVMERMTTNGFLDGPETLQRRELVWGVLREPPAPFCSHQRLVTDIAFLLQRHTRDRSLGQVFVSPIDVVLDEREALILQPDIIFISNDRLSILRNQVWGAPDLVVEVLSPGTAAYDQRRKLGWFRKYGVRECWFVDSRRTRVIVHGLAQRPSRKSIYRKADMVRSGVLPDLALRVADVFAE
ncbi:MAG: Uma2 family endonuclease [Acidobacteria bacterium]|nr:MAG: Uma2 family endonuclease [Acidobacteriota bacterium]